MTGSRQLTFSSARRAPRRWSRVVGLALGLVLLVVLGWLLTVAGLWGYSWARLGGDDLVAVDADRPALGASGATAPDDVTTLLVTLTAPVADDADDTEPPSLAGPVVLLQVGGSRDVPAALVLPADLDVTVDGDGTRSLAEVQAEGGPDVLAGALVDYTEVRIDHVVSATTDALPRLTGVLGGLEVCDPDCRTLDDDEVRRWLDDAEPDTVVDTAAVLVRSAAGALDTRTALTSPLTTKRTIDVLADEVTTDVALRGTRTLELASTLSAVDEVEIETLPRVTNPATGEVVPLDEPAMVRFQHLREGTPFSGAGTEELIEDLRGDVEVAIANGAGIDGLASDVRIQLESAGFVVVGTGNADSFDRERTVVSFVDDDPTVGFVAAELAALLGDVRLEALTAVPSFEGEPVEVLVTVGADLSDEGA